MNKFLSKMHIKASLGILCYSNKATYCILWKHLKASFRIYHNIFIDDEHFSLVKNSRIASR